MMTNTNKISAGNKRIAKNTFFLYVRNFFILIINLYTSRVILNTLGVSDYGIYNVVAGFVSMFGFLNASLTACIQRFYNFVAGQDGWEKVRNVYENAIFIQGALALVIIVLAETFGIWYLNNKLVIPIERLDAAKLLFQFVILSLVFVVLQVPFSSAVMAHEKMNYYATIGIMEVILKLIAVLSLPLFPCDRLSLYGLLIAIISFVSFGCYFIYSHKKFPEIRFSFSFDYPLFCKMLDITGWSVFGSFAQVMKGQGLNVILNLFFGPVVNAARGVSYQVKSAIMSFVQNITVATRPQLVESYSLGNYIRAVSLMNMLSKVCYYLLYMMMLPTAMEIDYILRLWLGDGVPMYTNTFTIIILIIALVDVLNTPVSMMIYASGDVKKYNIVTSFIGLSVLPVAYCLLYFFKEPILAFWASFLISIIIQISSIMILKSVTIFKISSYLKTVIIPLLVFTVIPLLPSLVIRHFMDESFLKFIVQMATSIIFSSLAFFSICLKREERTLIYNIVMRKFHNK